MTLSEHFSLSEFGEVPPETLPALTRLCESILEPLRVNFAEPFHITSGYRSPEHNARIGGSKASQHIYTAEHCAVDGFFASYRKNMRAVFDWLRDSKLPFDQIILEHGKYGDVIHISWRVFPRRMALEGQTYNASGYKSWSVGIGA